MKLATNNKDLALAIGKRIRVYREEQKESATRFAKECGVSRDSITKIENGTANPCINLLEKISKHMGITMEELYRWEEI